MSLKTDLKDATKLAEQGVKASMTTSSRHYYEGKVVALTQMLILVEMHIG